MQLLEQDEVAGIVYRRWMAKEPKAVLLLVHGLGAHSARWEALANFFVGKNISSYAVDLKGFGGAKGIRGHIDSFEEYFSDILHLYEIIKKDNPGKKIFLTGESLGALISFLLVSQKQNLFDGLICISPAFKANLKFSLLEYFRIFLCLLYNFKKQFRVPFDSAMCTRDADYQKIMNSDDKEIRFATFGLLFNILKNQLKVKFSKNKIGVPVLLLLSGKDRVVDFAESKKIFNGLETKDKTIICYSDMYHCLYIDIEKEKVFADMFEWLKKRI